ncbi:hypothetical protein TDB9533_04708 [Thalassocella blandensis]|nr:hypothetical protein TDB9533_04708 [Thalassocella blandensis]
MKEPLSATNNPRQITTALTQEALEAAAEWHVILQSEDADDSDLREFKVWRQNPVHAQAFRELERVWQKFDAAESIPAKQTLKSFMENESTKHSGRSKAAVLGCTICILLAVGLCVQHHVSFVPSVAGYLSPAWLSAEYKTAIGEQQKIILSDGSRMTLNTFTAVDLAFSESQRLIYLRQGEIEIDVAKDATRPLRVISQHGRATALGTRYSVRDLGDRSEVIVTESKVEVCAKQDKHFKECQLTTKGQSASLTTTRVTSPSAIDQNFVYDWNRQQLIVEEQPLVRVLDELARFHSGLIHQDQQELSGILVSGVFPITDPQAVLAVLEESLPIKITRYGSYLTVVKRQ